jgi:hypothetical protein
MKTCANDRHKAAIVCCSAQVIVQHTAQCTRASGAPDVCQFVTMRHPVPHPLGAASAAMYTRYGRSYAHGNDHGYTQPRFLLMLSTDPRMLLAACSDVRYAV